MRKRCNPWSESLSNNNQFGALNFPDFSYISKNIQKMLNEVVLPISEIFEDFQKRISTFAQSMAAAFRPLTAIEKLGNVQYVYWDFLTQDLTDAIINSENINKTLRELCAKNKFHKANETIQKCREHILLKPYERIFSQSIVAYREKQYDLATIGMLSIIDGLLSDVSGDAATSMYKRVDAILKKADETEIIESNDVAILALAWTVEKAVESLSTNQYPFSGKEPKNLNRHWIMHGRSHRRKTQLDCIKLINLIYGIVLVDEFNKMEHFQIG